MALYSAFGGMPGLMSAVVEEGFHRLEERLSTVTPSDDPVADLFAMAIECRHFAVENPHLYDVIFGPESREAIRGRLFAEAGHSSIDQSSYQQSFATLAQACDRAIAAGRVTIPSGRHLAAQLWSMVHGYISLELSGHFDGFANPVEEILVPLAVSFMTGQGDTRQLSLSSTRKTLA